MLETSIIQDGIRDPIILWKGKHTIVDGHNRHRIALKLGLERVPTVEKEFKNEADVRSWMLANQIGRRNVQNYLIPVYIARRVELLKESLGTTKAVNQVAEEQGVSPRQVYRDIEIDNALGVVDNSIRVKYLAGELSVASLLSELKRDIPPLPTGITKEERQEQANQAFPRSVSMVAQRVITAVENLRAVCRDVGLVFENQGLETRLYAKEIARMNYFGESLVDEAERLMQMTYENGEFRING